MTTAELLGRINVLWESRVNPTVEELPSTLAAAINFLLIKLIEELAKKDKVSNADRQAVVTQLPIELRNHLAQQITQYSQQNPLTKALLIGIANQLGSQLDDKYRLTNNPYYTVVKTITQQDQEKKTQLEVHKKKIQNLLHTYQTDTTKKTDDFTVEFDQLTRDVGVFVKENPQVVEQFLPFFKELQANIKKINAKVKAAGVFDWDMGGGVAKLFAIAEDVRKKQLPIIILLNEILEKAQRGEKGWTDDLKKYMYDEPVNKIVKSGKALQVTQKIIKALSKIENKKDRESLLSYMKDELVDAYRVEDNLNFVEMLQMAQKIHLFFVSVSDSECEKNDNLDFVITALNQKKADAKITQSIVNVFLKDKEFAHAMVAYLKTKDISLDEDSLLNACLNTSLVSREWIYNFTDYEREVDKFFRDCTINNSIVDFFDSDEIDSYYRDSIDRVEKLIKKGDAILATNPKKADDVLRLAQKIRIKVEEVESQCIKDKNHSACSEALEGMKNFISRIYPVKMKNFPLAMQKILVTIKQNTKWTDELKGIEESIAGQGKATIAVIRVLAEITSNKNGKDDAKYNQNENFYLNLFSMLDNIIKALPEDKNQEKIQLLFKVAKAKVESGYDQLRQSARKDYEMIVDLNSSQNQKNSDNEKLNEIALDNTVANNLVLSLEAAKELHLLYNFYSPADQAKNISSYNKNLDHVINILNIECNNTPTLIVKEILTILKNDTFKQALVSRIIARCDDPADVLNWETLKNSNNLLVRCFRHEKPIQKLHTILKKIETDTAWKKELNKNYAQHLIAEGQADLAVKEIMRKLDTPISPQDKLFLVDFMEEQLYENSIAMDNDISRRIFLKKSALEFQVLEYKTGVIDACFERYAQKNSTLDFKVQILELLYHYHSDSNHARYYVDLFINLTKDEDYKKDTSNKMPLLKESEFRQAIAKRMVERSNEDAQDINLSNLLGEKRHTNLLIKILEEATSRLKMSSRFKFAGAKTGSIKILYDAVKGLNEKRNNSRPSRFNLFLFIRKDTPGKRVVRKVRRRP